MRRVKFFLFALLACFALPGTGSASASTVATLPPCTAFQSPEQVNSVCSHLFKYNQVVSISPSIYFVWLRTTPASDSPFTRTIHAFNQPQFRIALATPRWDGRQWWWNIRASNDSRVKGWVEQASLVAGIVRPAPVPDTVVTTQAAFQPFQSGYMLWTANDERIYVFYKSYPTLTWYEIGNYRNNPDPVIEAPPPGLVAPIRGFARVWQRPDGSLKQYLGWGTAPESAVTATLTTHTANNAFQNFPQVYISQIQLSNGITFTIAPGSKNGLFWTIKR